MSKTQKQNSATVQSASAPETAAPKLSYDAVMQRFNNLIDSYGSIISAEMLQSLFSRGNYNANLPQIQNQRMKAISTLPAEYTKEEIGEYLRSVNSHEQQLRAVSQTLKWTAYPYYKIINTYQNVPTYRHYAYPMYLSDEDSKTDEYKRESLLIDKVIKAIEVESTAHRINGLAETQGKVFIYPRYKVDKSHNKVDYMFLQQLPQDWCTIIGYNNVSGYTVSFNMMYFLQPGTDLGQFGNLFGDELIDNFNGMFEAPKGKAVYASAPTVKCKGKGDIKFYPENVKANSEGNPRVFEQNGSWMYWVSLPVDKVYTFEIDDTTATVASPNSGLMLTYSQQADYEAAQLSLLLNPLIKIFTGEMPYAKDTGTKDDDGYRLSLGGRTLFQYFFEELMARNNTSGTALYLAPAENIKSHDFQESANANDISSSFNRYGIEKAGLAGLIPAASDPKAGVADLSAKLESRRAFCIYRQYERMMNNIFASLNLKYDWRFVMFGSIYTDEDTRKSAQSAISNGEISAHYILAALDGVSITDKLAMMRTVKNSGMLDMLIPPVTSYTMKQELSGLPPQNKEGGRPQSEEMGEAKEKAVDTGGSI